MIENKYVRNLLIVTCFNIIFIWWAIFQTNKKHKEIEKRIERIEKLTPTLKDMNFVLDEFQQTVDSLLIKIQQNKGIKQL